MKKIMYIIILIMLAISLSGCTETYSTEKDKYGGSEAEAVMLAKGYVKDRLSSVKSFSDVTVERTKFAYPGITYEVSGKFEAVYSGYFIIEVIYNDFGTIYGDVRISKL